MNRARDIDAYVYRILFNSLMSGRPRRWAGETPHALPPEEKEHDTSDQLALAASVRAALRRMTPEHRSVLVLRYFADLTDRQVADVLSAPIGTVRSRLARALVQLGRDEHMTGLSGKENSG